MLVMKLLVASILVLCVLSVKVVGINSPTSNLAPFKKAGGKQDNGDGPLSLFGSKSRNPEREQLYEAYNLLHTLAQVSARLMQPMLSPNCECDELQCVLTYLRFISYINSNYVFT